MRRMLEMEMAREAAYAVEVMDRSELYHDISAGFTWASSGRGLHVQTCHSFDVTENSESRN